MSCFKFGEMKRPEFSDRPVLEKAILALEPASCEMNFINILTWTENDRTLFAFAGEFPCFYNRNIDSLLFPGGSAKAPPPDLLAEISAELQAHGLSGKIRQVPEKYILDHPELTKFFRIEQGPESYGEYIYEVEKLIGLHGSKLAKKKNLIAQFKELYPDYKVVPFTPDRVADCRELCNLWAKHHGETETVREEELALRAVWQNIRNLDICGICIYIGEELVAFSLSSRLNSTTFDEHYEKTNPEYKGAAQIINHETVLALQSECTFLNREEDLGIEGLRHAKMSYVPTEIRRNWTLIPGTVPGEQV